MVSLFPKDSNAVSVGFGSGSPERRFCRVWLLRKLFVEDVLSFVIKQLKNQFIKLSIVSQSRDFSEY